MENCNCKKQVGIQSYLWTAGIPHFHFKHKLIHILTYLFLNNTGIDLGGGELSMSQELRYSFQRNPIGKSNSSGKSMPPCGK